jgi:hypothetical protein
VRDQQIEEARAANLRYPVVRSHEEERGQRHRFPRDHEHVGVIGDQYQRHRRQEDVVFKAEQAGRGAGPGAEIADREHRYRRAHDAQEQQEEGGQGVESQVERQIGETEGQDHRLRSGADG